MLRTKLLKLLKARLGIQKKDGFSDKQLNSFLELSAENLSLALRVSVNIDSESDDMFTPLLISYAIYIALSAQILSEKNKPADEVNLMAYMWEQAMFEYNQWRLMVKDARDMFNEAEGCECEECRGKEEKDEDVNIN